MTPRAYYNEVDAYAAQWLRNLIAAGLITAGDVDTRSILDVRPSDVAGYTRCHWFAGIGVWDYALALAGWPADRTVWTGSCPCQPFSAAGGRTGFADERHLWPYWLHLIRECGPDEVLGEQVASKDGLSWLDLVQDDLEDAGYAFGPTDLCAAGVGVGWEASGQHEWLQRAILDCSDPILAGELRDYAEWARRSLRVGPAHIRQRHWFVAHSTSERRDRRQAVAKCAGLSGAEIGSIARRLANADGRYASAEREQRGREHGQQPQDRVARSRDFAWLPCRDGRVRPFEPGTPPLVDGSAFRVGSGGPFEGKSRQGMIRGFGNAINAEAAATFISAYLDVRPEYRRAA